MRYYYGKQLTKHTYKVIGVGDTSTPDCTHDIAVEITGPIERTVEIPPKELEIVITSETTPPVVRRTRDWEVVQQRYAQRIQSMAEKIIERVAPLRVRQHLTLIYPVLANVDKSKLREYFKWHKNMLALSAKFTQEIADAVDEPTMELIATEASEQIDALYRAAPNVRLADYC